MIMAKFSAHEVRKYGPIFEKFITTVRFFVKMEKNNNEPARFDNVLIYCRELIRRGVDSAVFSFGDIQIFAVNLIAPLIGGVYSGNCCVYNEGIVWEASNYNIFKTRLINWVHIWKDRGLLEILLQLKMKDNIIY